MSTTVRERPAAGPASAGGSGGAPARRAVVRWALRLFRREWRRQVLVLAMLAVAVAAMVVGLGAVTSAAQLKADPTFGTADSLLALPGSDPQLDADVAAIEQRFGAAETIAHTSVPVPGSVSTLDVRAQDPSGPFGRVTLRLDRGRYPVGPGEVAVTSGAAQAFDLTVGDNWTVNRQTLKVVGIVENPLDLLDQFALVAPGQLTPAQSVSVLFDAGPKGPGEIRLPSHSPVGVSARGVPNRDAVAAVFLVLGALGLIFVGLMAVAGFAVMAQRRLRSLGMLRSLGATDRHLRLVMLANGAAVGLTAAIVGAAGGLAAWFALVPAFESITEHRIDRFGLPWWAVGAAMALTVVTSLLAAWWPARVVSRISAVAALSGRAPRPRPAHRFAAVGGALFATGIVLLAFADEKRAGFIIGGTAATAIGLLLLAPLAIRLLAVAAGRSSISVTLALRDLARYQARSGASLGAVTMALGIAASIVVGAAATKPAAVAGNLPTDELMVYTSPGGGPGNPLPLLSSDQLATANAAVDRIAADLHAGAALTLEQAYDPNSAQVAPAQPGGGGHVVAAPGSAPAGGPNSGYITASLATVRPNGRGEEITNPITLYVATPSVLARYGISAGQIDAGADVLSSRTDLAGRQIFEPSYDPGRASVVPDDITHPVIQVAHQLPDYSSDPVVLLTPHAIQALGFAAMPTAWLIKAPHPLTAAEIGVARKTAAAAGVYTETRRPLKSTAPLRNGATTGGILLALGVLAMTVGLIRSETAGDLRTLTATGASSHTRRALTGVTAGALALLGALMGTAGAYAALFAWYRHDLSPLGHVPVADLVAIVVGLPVVAAVGGWLLAGREPAAIARRPLE
jgi:putative ABC transport system permease protein